MKQHTHYIYDLLSVCLSVCLSYFYNHTGNIYIADCDNNRIRMVSNPTPPTITPTFEPTVTPTFAPTIIPTYAPSDTPTVVPTFTPTVVPTFVPSPTPTTSPTSVLGVSVFDGSMSEKVAKEKTRYYIVSFVSYFLAIYLILYLIKWSKYGRSTVDALHRSAYESHFYVTKLCSIEQSSPFDHDESCVLKSIIMKNRELLRLHEEEVSKPDEGEKDDIRYTFDDDSDIKRISVDGSIKMIEDDAHADVPYEKCKPYVNYVADYRYLLGCEPILFNNGITINFYIFKSYLRPGFVENLILFLCNNSQFFSLLYCMDSQTNIQNFGIIVYIVRECVVFVLSQFILALVHYFSVDTYEYVNPLVDFFVVTPASIAVGSSLVLLYTAPCADRVNNRYLKRFIRCLSRITIVPILTVLSVALISACILTTGRKVPMILMKFFFTVQLFSILIEIGLAIFGYVDNYFFRFTVFGCIIFSAGDYYAERIVSEKLISGVDYLIHQRVYLLDVFRVTTIMCRLDAIKKGYHMFDANDDGSSDNNIEFKVLNFKQGAISSTTNPIRGGDNYSNRADTMSETIFISTDAAHSNTSKPRAHHNDKTKVKASSIDPSEIYTDINL